MKNGFFMEHNTIKAAKAPADNAAGVTGERIGLSKTDSVAVIMNMGDSTGGTVVTVSFVQSTANVSGSSKALTLDNPYFHRVTSASTATDGYFTKVPVTTAASSFDLASIFETEPGIVVFEVNGSDLDLDNGYTHFHVVTAATSEAKIISTLYVCNKPRFLPPYDVEV